MYNYQYLKIKDISEFPITTLELIISRDCNMACSYCFLNGNTKDHSKKFNRWNDLYFLISKLSLPDKLTIGLCTGELFTDSNISYLFDSLKNINKIQRFSNTSIHYRLYSNGSYAKNIIDIIEYIGRDKINIGISYDGPDSNRIFKPKYNIDLDSQLKLLTPYADIITPRYAISDHIENMFETFKYLYDIGFKSVEYYMIHDYHRYTDDQYIDAFTAQLDSSLSYFKDKDFHIYNLDKYINKSKYNTECSYGNTLVVGIDGELTICPFLYENSKNNFMIDLIEYRKIPIIIDKFQSEYMINRELLDCIDCNNFLCKECCSYRAISNNEMRRINQQCNLRHAELAVYDKLYGDKND